MYIYAHGPILRTLSNFETLKISHFERLMNEPSRSFGRGVGKVK